MQYYTTCEIRGYFNIALCRYIKDTLSRIFAHQKFHFGLLESIRIQHSKQKSRFYLLDRLIAMDFDMRRFDVRDNYVTHATGLPITGLAAARHSYYQPNTSAFDLHARSEDARAHSMCSDTLSETDAMDVDTTSHDSISSSPGCAYSNADATTYNLHNVHKESGTTWNANYAAPGTVHGTPLTHGFDEALVGSSSARPSGRSIQISRDMIIQSLRESCKRVPEPTITPVQFGFNERTGSWFISTYANYTEAHLFMYERTALANLCFYKKHVTFYSTSNAVGWQKTLRAALVSQTIEAACTYPREPVLHSYFFRYTDPPSEKLRTDNPLGMMDLIMYFVVPHQTWRQHPVVHVASREQMNDILHQIPNYDQNLSTPTFDGITRPIISTTQSRQRTTVLQNLVARTTQAIRADRDAAASLVQIATEPRNGGGGVVADTISRSNTWMPSTASMFVDLLTKDCFAVVYQVATCISAFIKEDELYRYAVALLDAVATVDRKSVV